MSTVARTNTASAEKEYVSTISFSLNFEDKVNSIKLKEGDKLKYDGYVAVCNYRGEEVRGKTSALRSAIERGWLTENAGKTSEAPAEISTKTQTRVSQDDTYDEKKGGNFDEFVRKTQLNVITENDTVVKDLQKKGQTAKPKKGEKLSVDGDQVAVKNLNDERLVVGSSTSIPRSGEHSTKVERSDAYGADDSKDMDGVAVKKTASAPSKKNSYTVDATTPSVPQEATKEELNRAKGVVNADESQDAKVVGTVKEPKGVVKETEGIVLKKTESPKDMTVPKASTRSTGETAVVINEDSAVVVKKVGEEAPKKAAEEAPKEVAEESSVLKDLFDDEDKASEDTKSAEETKQNEEGKTEEAQETEDLSKDGGKDYLAMLPKGWAKMHWTKIEKFIKGLDDVGFLRYLRKVESRKVILRACGERLEALGAKKSG